MNIQTSDLKRFQKLATHIKSNGILPIHGYLRFGGGEICKNVGTAFIKLKCEEATDEILVNEKDLYSLLNVTVSSFISINKKKDKVELNDGRDKIGMAAQPFKIYGSIPETPEKKTDVSGDFLTAILKATKFTNEIDGGPEFYKFVHIGEGFVCAGDGIIAFQSPIEEKVKMVIEDKTADFISRQEITHVSEQDNYYFFISDDAVFGFAKSVVGWFDIRPIFAHPRQHSFTVESSDLKSFNTLSLQLARVAKVTLSTGKFELLDVETEKEHERPADYLKVPKPFTYNPERMNSLIDGFGCKEIEFHDGGPSLYYLMSPETKATAIIAKIQK